MSEAAGSGKREGKEGRERERGKEGKGKRERERGKGKGREGDSWDDLPSSYVRTVLLNQKRYLDIYKEEFSNERWLHMNMSKNTFLFIFATDKTMRIRETPKEGEGPLPLPFPFLFPPLPHIYVA